MDIWTEIASGRRRLVELLRGLEPSDWRAPSLCTGWQVRDVVAHLISPLITSRPGLLLGFARSGFNLDRYNRRRVTDVAQRSDADLLATLEANVAHRFTPPGFGPEAPLTDVTIHTLDIRWPLGRRDAVPEETARVVLDLLAGGRGKEFVPPSRTADLRFGATDLDWSSGTGADVVGSSQALMLALTGRRAGLDQLEGPGVPTLRERLSADGGHG